MWHSLETTRYQDMNELLQRRDSLREKSSELSEELKCITPELEKRTAQLRASGQDLAATEKVIKDTQEKIAVLYRNQAEMEKRSVFFQKELREIQAIEAERTKLRDANDALRIDMENTESDIRAVSESIADFEAGMKEMTFQVAEQEAERDSLSKEISKIMENTSLDREKMEAELNDLSVDFVSKIGERDALKERVSAADREIEPVNESIAELEQKIQSLEEVKNLHAHRNTLRADVEKQKNESLSVAAKREELQEALSGRQKQYDTLSTENAERKEEMISLEEQVVVYDAAFTATHAAQEEWNSSLELVGQHVESLAKDLGEKTGLEKELRMVMERTGSLIQTFSSLTQE